MSTVLQTILILSTIIVSTITISAFLNRAIKNRLQDYTTDSSSRAEENRLVFEALLLMIRAIKGEETNGELECMEKKIHEYLLGLIKSEAKRKSDRKSEGKD